MNYYTVPDDTSQSFDQNLGWIDSAITAGAGIFNSIVGARASKKASEAEMKQWELQMQAQREQSMSKERMLKMALIGGGTLLAGGLLIVVLRRSLSDGKSKTSSMKGLTKSLPQKPSLSGKRSKGKKPALTHKP